MHLCITVLMGLPGSGKTTFAKTLKENFKFYNGKHYNFINVHYDELIPVRKVYEHKWKELRTSVFNEVNQCLMSILNNNSNTCPDYLRSQFESHSQDTGIVIVIDDNMYLRSMRYLFYKKAKELNLSFCQVYMKSTLESSIDRNFSRSLEESVPVEIIVEMSHKLEPPRLDNKWEQHSLIIDTDEDLSNCFSDYFEILNKAFQNPESPDFDENISKQESYLLCMTNVLHQCDLALRHAISEKIRKFISENTNQNKNTKNLKSLSTCLSRKKGNILNDIRLGAIQLPNQVLQEIQQKDLTDKENLKLFFENLLLNV